MLFVINHRQPYDLSSQQTGDATRSEQLQVAQVWLINQQTCTNRHNEAGFAVTNTMVCAGWLDVGVRGQCEVSYHLFICSNPSRLRTNNRAYKSSQADFGVSPIETVVHYDQKK